MRTPRGVGSCVIVLATLASAPLTAQCPDGSPPPCNRRLRVDTNVFVVLPFRGPATALDMRESMVDLLHMALDGIGPVTVRLPQTALRRLRGAADPTDPTAAVDAIRSLGAGRAISGAVVQTGTELRVRVDVYDVVRERPLFFVEGRGPVASLGQIVDRVAADVLARKLVPASQRMRVDLADYTTRSPEALLAYLAAMRHVRRAERRVAADSLRSAIRLDPNFGLAYYRLFRLESSQLGVTQFPGGPAGILRAARAVQDSFPARVRELFDVVELNLIGDRVRARRLSSELLAKRPSDPDVLLHVADGAFHYGLNLGEPRVEVLAKFQRAMDLDESDPELLDHYNVLLQENGDTMVWRAAQRHCHSIAPTLCGDNYHRMYYDGERPWARRPVDSIPDLFLWPLRASPSLPFAVAALDSVHAARSTSPDRRRWYGALLTRVTILDVQGRHAQARTLVDSLMALNDSGPHNGMALLHGIVSGRDDSTHVAQARRLLSRRALWAAGLLAWHAAVTADRPTAEEWIAPLERFSWPDSATGRAMARALRGVVDLRHGDTSAFLTAYAMARDNHMRRVLNRTFWPGSWLALVAARIEASRGRWEEARLYLADVYPYTDAAPWVTETEELRARVALALGDRDGARKALTNVVEIWKDADPVLQPRVDAARAALATLNARP